LHNHTTFDFGVTGYYISSLWSTPSKLEIQFPIWTKAVDYDTQTPRKKAENGQIVSWKELPNIEFIPK